MNAEGLPAHPETGSQLAAGHSSPPGQIGEDRALGIHACNPVRMSTVCQLFQIINVNRIAGWASPARIGAQWGEGWGEG